MARECQICGKGIQSGYKVSHAHNRSKKLWHANVQSVRTVINGVSKKIKVCTGCLKSNKVQKAI